MSNDWGLTDKGLNLPRTADFLRMIREGYEARTGLNIDWEHDTALGTLTAIFAEQLGHLAGVLMAIQDSKDPEKATGHSLDALCNLVGITREPARSSTVTLRLEGHTGTTVPAGKIAEDNNGQRWVLTEEVTLEEDEEADEEASAEVEAEADETGPIDAQAGAIDSIVTPVAGWKSVTNPEKPTMGADRESDAALRRRRRRSLQIVGGSSRGAIRAALLDVEGVASAEVFDNPKSEPRTVTNFEAPPHSVIPYVMGTEPDGSLANEQIKIDVATVLMDRVVAGVVTAGVDEEMTAVTVDGTKTPVRWSTPELVEVDVEIVVEGVDPEVVEDEVRDRVDDYFDELLVGEDVRRLPILVEIARVEGVTAAEVKLARDGSPEDADVSIESWEFATLHQFDLD